MWFLDQRRKADHGRAGVGASVFDALATPGANAAPQRNRTGNWIVRIDPEAVKHAPDRVVGEAGVEVLTHTRLVGATSLDGALTSVTLQDRSGASEVSADAVVDASGDANLERLAGGAVADHDRPVTRL